MSLKIIIFGIQKTPILVKLIVTVISRLLAKKCIPKSLCPNVIISEIVNFIKIVNFLFMFNNILMSSF
jgi:hypothetical protein